MHAMERLLRDRAGNPVAATRLLVLFSLMFWAFTYVLFSLRAELLHHESGDLLSFKRVLVTLFGAGLFFIGAARIGRFPETGRPFYLFLALVSVCASLVLLLFRLAYEAVTEPNLSGLTGHGLWVVVWCGYFLAWLALVTSERSAALSSRAAPRYAATQDLEADAPSPDWQAPRPCARLAEDPVLSSNPGLSSNPVLSSNMSEAEMRARLAELAPFHHAIDLPFGLSTYDGSVRNRDRESLGRIDSFKTHVWPRLLDHFGGTLEGQRVIDVACNCGGFSIMAAQAGASEVFGFDSEEHYIRQARFIQECRGQDGIRFEVEKLENVTAERHGRFDVAFFCGILYHLEDPIGGLHKIASLADTIVVDTHLMRVPFINRFLNKPLWNMKIVSPVEGPDTTTGLWRKTQHCQFTPNWQAVVHAMQFAGFDYVEYLEPTARGLENRYYRKTRGVFIGRKRFGA